MKSRTRIIAAAVLMALAPLAVAQSTGGSGSTTTANGGQTLVATRIASNFSGLAGGEENALALVYGLRNGTAITLKVPPPTDGTGTGTGTPTPPAPTEVAITPPTRPMGWGNVKMALGLARDALTRAGITNPTAEQLQTALMGGDITVTNADGTTSTVTLKGILTMRAEGMGWGTIAREGGTKPGAVMREIRMGNNKVAPPAEPAPQVTSKSTLAATATSKGVTTAAGAAALGSGNSSRGVTTASGAANPSSSRGLVNAGGAASRGGGNAYGRGIVSGAGGGAATTVAAAGNGRPSTGAGLVTGGGGAASGVTHGNAGGNGGGNGKGAGNGKGPKG